MMPAKRSANQNEKRLAILRNRSVWAGFDQYFASDWQARELLNQLNAEGCDLKLLAEWAIWSFHEAARDEACQKRRRGKKFRGNLRTAITGYESAVDAYGMYSFEPRARELIESHQQMARDALATLVRAKDAFDTDRLGRTWHRAYLVLMREYIAHQTGWADSKILSAMTHLVMAARNALSSDAVQSPPRDLLRKALRDFESDDRNQTILRLIRKTASDPDQLYRLFPYSQRTHRAKL